MRYFVLKLATVAILLVGLSGSVVHAEFTLNYDFEADQTIEAISVQITVGDEGDDLGEPIALDLGLGFPLWLYPVGHEASDPVPFGAIPQESTASAKLPAGSSATFSFRLDGESGQDTLLTTPRLLAGVRVSDIARIGFLGRGMTDWNLAAYEIKINDQVFAVNDQVDRKFKDAQEAASFELADLEAKTGPMKDELADLHALIEVKLATNADQQRAADLEGQLADLKAQVKWLNGQVAGQYPCFEDEAFLSPWRTKASITEATAIVVTNIQPGADTRNFVYFSTDGKKYVLNPLAQPLEGQLGSQKFALDLLSGPLTAADLRGYGVGVLAPRSPHGTAPDRWHPQRVLVELDERLVYDSDESPIDRNSLEAVHVIPPAHLDTQGKPIENTPSARETYLWEAGMGIGLAPESGGALPLPPLDESGYPPGEEGGPGDDNLADGGGLGSGDGSWPGDGLTGVGSGIDWIDWLLGWLLDNLAQLGPGVDPPTGGAAFGIDSVVISKGWKYEDEFTVQWTISGDENAIDHYEVRLVYVEPDKTMPFRFESPLLLGNVPRGSRSITAPLSSIPVGNTSLKFAAPVVIAVPSDPKVNPYWRPGPARPIFPIGTEPFGQPNLMAKYYFGQMLNPKTDTIKLQQPQSSTGRAVWVPGQIESHNAILFDNPKPAMHVVMRPEPGDDMMAIEFTRMKCTGKIRIGAYVGFVGGGSADSEVEVAMACAAGTATPNVGKLYAPKVVTLKNAAGGSPTPMVLIDQVVDQADIKAPVDSYNVWIVLRFQMKKVDPANPPAVFGFGIIPVQ